MGVRGARNLPSLGRRGSEVGEGGGIRQDQGPGADLGQSKAARVAARAAARFQAKAGSVAGGKAGAQWV